MSAPLLFAIAREESAFDARALSWAGARGLCQLMPNVALMQAAKLKMKVPSLAELFLPEINAYLGADHFMDQFKSLGHPLLAIAAYNGGAGSVRKWLNKMPKSLFPVDVFVEQIPFEQTREYVKKVSNAWMTYVWLGNLEKPDFALSLQKP
jgi:soluble lytic murein transglycosylase